MLAFDKVPYKRLSEILKCYCIPSKIVDWIESSPSSREQETLHVVTIAMICSTLASL